MSGRNHSHGSSGHRCTQDGRGYYKISWSVTRYYHGSRLRFMIRHSRMTDEKGARRFCKKWNLNLPDGSGIVSREGIWVKE